METLFETDVWTVKLPKKWEGEHGDECATFFHIDGVGALQIQSFVKESDVDDDDLYLLAGELLTPGEELTELRVGDFNGFQVEREVEGEYWKHWFVSSGNCALAATYNCDEEDKLKEAGVVQEILRSLRVG